MKIALRRKDLRPAHEAGVSTATAHRIDQQIKRAIRHTFGAESGLRMLVKLGATEMLRAGATRDAVHKALEAHVDAHAGMGKPSLLTGESRSDALRKLVRNWCEEACDEFGRAPDAEDSGS